ncbi:MAG: sensor histidine kinase [Alphaproteobacteria bacterium]|nr:sensor histidine kinase [Alphaproteobacteria bacterium]
MSVSGFALSALFGDAVRNSFDARLAVLLEGVVAGTTVADNGRLDLSLQLGEPRFDQPFSGWYWQISDGEQPVRRSASLWAQALVLPHPEDGEVVLAEVPGPSEQTLRVLIRPITLPGLDRPFWYAIAGDESELREPKNRFDRLLGLTLAMLFAGVLAAILIQVRFGLQPLFRIQRALSAIRSGESRRLEGAYPSEIQPLARELNALIDHSETLIERAQTHVGNLAHGLKTPLSVLANEARDNGSSFGDLVDRQTTLMREQVEHHLSRARAAATSSILGARSEVLPALGDLKRTLERIHHERGVEIEVDCPDDLVFRGARHDLEEMLGNLMDNACKWARSRVRVRAERQGDKITLVIEDDGDGLPPSKRAEVLKRGRRLDESVPGTGLGLSIVVDLASLHGGSFELGDSELGGLAATLHLPAGDGVRGKARS